MSIPMTRRSLGILALVGALTATIGCAPPSATTPPAPAGTLVHTLTYVAGDSWKHDEPITAQGLDPHFVFMGEHFANGTLVANGPFADAIEGLYVFAVDDRSDMDAIVASDPAVEAGTLRPQKIEPWLLIVDHLDAPPREGESLFVLEYGPGPRWKDGKPLGEQKIGPHMDYVSHLFEAGDLIAGGPIPGADGGRYIVSVPTRQGAQQLVDHDPGVAKGVFSVRVRPWMAAQRQSVGRADSGANSPG